MIRRKLVLAAGAILLAGVFACGKPSPEKIEQLTKELSAKASGDRNRAALELAGYGGTARAAVPGLARCLRDENSGVRSSAAYALREIGTPDAIKALDSYQP